MRAGHKFAIGVAGVPVPDAPRPRENEWNAAVMHHYWHELTAEQRQQPEWAPSNTERYDAEFRRIHQERMTFWDGEGPPPREHNIEGQYAFCGMSGRTLAAIMAHIDASDEPRLEVPSPTEAPPPPPARRWGPRASTPSSSQIGRAHV